MRLAQVHLPTTRHRHYEAALATPRKLLRNGFRDFDRDMLEQRPTTSSAMLNVSGVGDVKLERFDGEFLEVIREFEYPA